MNDKKLQDLKNALKGKYLSLIGDSITTYDGFSNVNVNNSTVYTGESGNPTYPYCDVQRVEQTYWRLLLDDTGMKLLVNNSIGGSRAFGEETDGYATCNFRCVNLHADAGELKGTEPDVIIIYIGINDVGYTAENVGFPGVLTETEEDFGYGYGKTLAKIKERYKNSDVFVMDLPAPDNPAYLPDRLASFNANIRKFAKKENFNLISLSGSVADDGKNLTCDTLHPNAKGMDKYRTVIEDAFYKQYCK